MLYCTHMDVESSEHIVKNPPNDSSDTHHREQVVLGEFYNV